MRLCNLDHNRWSLFPPAPYPGSNHPELYFSSHGTRSETKKGNQGGRLIYRRQRTAASKSSYGGYYRYGVLSQARTIDEHPPRHNAHHEFPYTLGDSGPFFTDLWKTGRRGGGRDRLLSVRERALRPLEYFMARRFKNHHQCRQFIRMRRSIW